MPIAYKFERRMSGKPALPATTKDALCDLEASLARAFEQLASNARPAFRHVLSSGNCLAQPWDLVTMREGGTVLLPEPSPQNRGAEVGVIRDTASTVTVAPLVGLVNGAASDAPTQSRITYYTCNGQGWFANA